MMKFQITVKPKEGVLDPEMATLHNHLTQQGEGTIAQMVHWEIYQITLENTTDEEGERLAKKLAEDYFANREIHQYQLVRLE